MQEALGVLQHSPLIGSQRATLAPGLRVFFHGAYALYYAPRGDDLVLVRVLHGARDVDAIAERGGFSE